MTVQLNHTIIHATDRSATADFLVSILGLPEAAEFGPFLVVQTDNGVSLDVMHSTEEFSRQHYAFLVEENEFDTIFGRIREKGLTYWAGPGHRGAGEINTNDGGRGVYFDDPDGHVLEILTRPYGSGGA
ncbi:VOC family protein [Amycolatopsis regifaucium]|uniref:Bleomycin resistance protein n=1 Tax=Amycolatopsis regifaucium TaxID=546365 RepID=A0A154M4K8_9PSEU|nr:VOC family protein [Amycolatopsis regifaucium]KZB79548.1 bleomycin resistance protein [Amycolatopsis regifaucium]OKA07833.1 bleomycin resistance protein [Amycolatopsis regifaucium]